MGSKVAKLLGTLAPVAASFIPGLGPLGAAAIGAGGGLLSGGGLKGALLGGLTSGAGNYLSNGGFSQLFPETSNNLFNATGGLIGSATGTAPTPGSFSSLFSGGSSGSSGGFNPDISSGGSSGFINAPDIASTVNLGGGGSSPSLAGFGKDFSLASTPSAGIGGGYSSYIGPIAGAANSLYANSQAQSDLLKAQKNSMNVLQPYLNSGGASNARLSELLGIGGDPNASDYGSLAKTFQPGDLTQDPGYQFQLKQGEQALSRQQAAKGNLNSGAALKAAEDYGQGLAGTTYNNAYQRWLQDQQQKYGEFAGQSGQGYNAATAAGNIFGNTGNAQAGAGISAANITNQTLSSLLNGSGARRLVGHTQSGQPIYA